MRLALAVPWLLLSLTSLITAQRSDGQFWPCNPTNESCSPLPGLSKPDYTIDFTKTTEWPAGWNQSLHTTPIQFNDSGAQIIFGKDGDAPQMMTNFFFLFGKIDVWAQAAPGTGIISSVVLISDDFDEVDWEWSGSSFGKSDLVQTNYFGKGVVTGWDRGSYENVSNPNSTVHKYSLDWNKDRLIWLIDDNPVRTLTNNASADVAHQYPQSPCKLQIGLWNAGDHKRTPDDGTLIWAGGYTDMAKLPYTMRITKVSIQNSNPAYAYNWTDRTGSYQSIDSIQDPHWNGTTTTPPASNTTTLPTATGASTNFSSDSTLLANLSSITDAPITMMPSAASSVLGASVTQLPISSNSSFGFFPTNTSSSMTFYGSISGTGMPIIDSNGGVKTDVSAGSPTALPQPQDQSADPLSSDGDDLGSNSPSSPSGSDTKTGSGSRSSPQVSGAANSASCNGSPGPSLRTYAEVVGPAAPKGPAGHGSVLPSIENTDLGPNRPPPQPVADNSPTIDGPLVSVPQGNSDGDDGPGTGASDSNAGMTPSSTDMGSGGTSGSTSGVTFGSSSGVSTSGNEESSSDGSSDGVVSIESGKSASSPVGAAGIATKDLCADSKSRVLFYHQGSSNYTVQCNADMPHMNTKNMTSKSFKSCIGLCEEHNVKANGTTCDGVSYMPSANLCHLKSFSGARLVPARHSNNTHMAFNMSKKNSTAPIGFSRHYGRLTTRHP